MHTCKTVHHNVVLVVFACIHSAYYCTVNIYITSESFFFTVFMYTYVHSVRTTVYTVQVSPSKCEWTLVSVFLYTIILQQS